VLETRNKNGGLKGCWQCLRHATKMEGSKVVEGPRPLVKNVLRTAQSMICKRCESLRGRKKHQPVIVTTSKPVKLPSTKPSYLGMRQNFLAFPTHWPGIVSLEEMAGYEHSSYILKKRRIKQKRRSPNPGHPDCNQTAAHQHAGANSVHAGADRHNWVQASPGVGTTRLLRH